MENYQIAKKILEDKNKPVDSIKNWIKNQKGRYKRNKLNNQEIQLLENIPEWKW
jgi:hypothetical protein